MKLRAIIDTHVGGSFTTWMLIGLMVAMAGSGNTERASGRSKVDFAVAETYCPEVGPCKPGQQRKPKGERVERHHDDKEALLWIYLIS